jgi:uncharacterized protein affecting Mg2+/Co2+ transport
VIGAEVYVDGVKKGIAPLKINGLSEGIHIVEIMTKDMAAKVEIIGKNGETKIIELALTRKIFTARISAKPPMIGAEVIVDGFKKGAAPLVVIGLIEGSHIIEIKAGDMMGEAEIIGKNGETKIVELELTKLSVPKAAETESPDEKFELENTMITVGLQTHLNNTMSLKNRIDYMTLEYQHAITNSGAMTVRFFSNGNTLTNDIGGGLSYRWSLDPPTIDNGVYLGIGVDLTKEFLGLFITPKVEFGYSLFIGGIALSIEANTGYAKDIAYSNVYKLFYHKINTEWFDYQLGIKAGYRW